MGMRVCVWVGIMIGRNAYVWSGKSTAIQIVALLIRISFSLSGKWYIFLSCKTSNTLLAHQRMCGRYTQIKARARERESEHRIANTVYSWWSKLIKRIKCKTMKRAKHWHSVPMSGCTSQIDASTAYKNESNKIESETTMKTHKLNLQKKNIQQQQQQHWRWKYIHVSEQSTKKKRK